MTFLDCGHRISPSNSKSKNYAEHDARDVEKKTFRRRTKRNSNVSSLYHSYALSLLEMATSNVAELDKYVRITIHLVLLTNCLTEQILGC